MLLTEKQSSMLKNKEQSKKIVLINSMQTGMFKIVLI